MQRISPNKPPHRRGSPTKLDAQAGHRLQQAAAYRIGPLVVVALLGLTVALMLVLPGGAFSARAASIADLLLLPWSHAPTKPAAASPLLQVPWKPLLSQRQLQRGLSYFGSGDRLRALAAKLLAGQPITAVTLGGSITRGSGAGSPDANYPAMFFKMLRHNFPHEGHVFVNKGLGGASSGIYSACTEQLVPQDADLVVLEFTLNDQATVPLDSPDRRGFERLIRKLLRLPRRPALLVLHHYAWWQSYGDGKDFGLFYAEPEAQLTTFSHYYDLPAVSVRAAAWWEMYKGRPGFRVDRLITADRTARRAVPGVRPTDPRPQFFYNDRVHPSRVGHAALAELLTAPLERAVQEAAAEAAAAGDGGAAAAAGGAAGSAGSAGEQQQQGPKGKQPQQKGPKGKQQQQGEGEGDVLDELPPPMIPNTPDVPTSFCAMQEAFKGVVKRSSGFEYRPERPNGTSFEEQKWGWRGVQPGSWAELEVDTRASSAPGAASAASAASAATSAATAAATATSAAAAENATVMLSYLRSYEGMGTASLACVAGCECAVSQLDASWTDPVSLLQLHSFQTTQHARCRIRVTINKASGAASKNGGHKVVLAAVMVTQFPIKLGTTWQLEAALGVVPMEG